jgi:hypothetical protein
MLASRQIATQPRRIVDEDAIEGLWVLLGEPNQIG